MFKSRALNRILLASSILAIGGLGGGCSSLDRLASIGEKPKLSAIDNPTTQAGYKPVSMPMPAPQAASYNPNSLWRNGSRAFFKDQRAHQIGDILTVTVNITDKANIANETQRSRANTEDSGITNFFGKSKVPVVGSAIPGRLLRPTRSARLQRARRRNRGRPHRRTDPGSQRADHRKGCRDRPIVVQIGRRAGPCRFDR